MPPDQIDGDIQVLHQPRSEMIVNRLMNPRKASAARRVVWAETAVPPGRVDVAATGVSLLQHVADHSGPCCIAE